MRAGERAHVRTCGMQTSALAVLGEHVASHYLPQLSLTERKRIHKSLSDDRQAAVQIWRLRHVEYKLGVLDDVDPEAKGQTVPQ